MKLIRQSDGYWRVEHNGVIVIHNESYEVASQIVEGNGTGETEEVRNAILRFLGLDKDN